MEELLPLLLLRRKKNPKRKRMMIWALVSLIKHHPTILQQIISLYTWSNTTYSTVVILMT